MADEPTIEQTEAGFEAPGRILDAARGPERAVPSTVPGLGVIAYY